MIPSTLLTSKSSAWPADDQETNVDLSTNTIKTDSPIPGLDVWLDFTNSVAEFGHDSVSHSPSITERKIVEIDAINSTSTRNTKKPKVSKKATRKHQLTNKKIGANRPTQSDIHSSVSTKPAAKTPIASKKVEELKFTKEQISDANKNVRFLGSYLGACLGGAVVAAALAITLLAVSIAVGQPWILIALIYEVIAIPLGAVVGGFSGYGLASSFCTLPEDIGTTTQIG